MIFGASAVLMSLGLMLPMPPGTYRGPLLILNGVVAMLGVVAWFVPWERRWWLWFWVFVPAMFGIVAVANVVGGLEPYSYAVHLTVPFLWIGVTSPRGTSLTVWPLAVAAYVVPLHLLGGPLADMLTVVYVLPVWLLAAESLAWVVAKLDRAERSLVRANQDITRLFRAATSLGISVHHAAEAADAIAHTARGLLDSSSASVLLVDTGNRSLLHHVGGSKDDLPLGGPTVTLTPQLADQIRKPRIRPVADHLEPSLRTLLDAIGVDAAAAIALLDTDDPPQLLGVVVLGWRASESARPEQGMLERAAALLSDQGSRLVLQARNVEQLSRDAETDALTDLANRCKLRTVMDDLHPGGAVAVIDLDHFKGVNDRYGHSVGDQVLRDLAACLRQVCRACDTTARVGGEEFVIVCSDGGAAAALQAIGRLRSHWQTGPRLATFSAGIAEMVPGDTPTQLLHRADQSLYAAKSAGRNRTVVGESPVAV